MDPKPDKRIMSNVLALGLQRKDNYDGLSKKLKTIPPKQVSEWAIIGTLLSVILGLTGPWLLCNASVSWPIGTEIAKRAGD